MFDEVESKNAGSVNSGRGYPDDHRIHSGVCFGIAVAPRVYDGGGRHHVPGRSDLSVSATERIIEYRRLSLVPLSYPAPSVRIVVRLHVNKLTTGQTVCTVMHDWGKGVWTETIAGALREGNEYARFEVQPGIEVRIRYIDGELIAETRSCGEVYLIKSTPPPWQYHRG